MPVSLAITLVWLSTWQGVPEIPSTSARVLPWGASVRGKTIPLHASSSTESIPTGDQDDKLEAEAVSFEKEDKLILQHNVLLKNKLKEPRNISSLRLSGKCAADEKK